MSARIYTAGVREAPRGHLGRTGKPSVTRTDNTADWRRALLYMNCERAPLGWENRRLNG